MPPPSSQSNRSIRDFFKPFTLPKNRIPVNDVIEDEIIVASRRPSSPSDNVRSRQPTASPTKSRKSSKTCSNASTPTRRSPTKRQKQRPALPQLDGAVNDADALIHVSPSSSQQRRLVAVEIPSPKPLPPPAQLKREAPTRKATASFSSVSTLSSVPVSTQSSSRRVVKDGVQAVTNSDSASAGGDSDELEDASTFITRKRRKLTPPGRDMEHAIEIPSTVKPTRQITRLSDKSSVRSSRTGTPRLPPSPPRTVYKHSLLSMVKRHEKQEKTDARVKAAEAEFEEAQQRREEALAREQSLNGGLKAAVADDSDEGERMMLAMERTEALQDEETFHFFFSSKTRAGREVFPQDGLPDKPWAKLLANEQSRTQACLTGFVTDLAARNLLPTSAQAWFGREVLFETRQDLCEAYCQIITALPRNQRQSVFHAFEHYDTNFPRSAYSTVPLYKAASSLPPNFRYSVRVAQYKTENSSYDARNGLVCELAMLRVDENVKQDSELQHIIQTCTEEMLDRIPGDDVVDFLKSVAKELIIGRADRLSLQVRCRIINSFPVAMQRCHDLRRWMALQCFADSDKDLPEPASEDWTNRIVARMKKAPEFAISESTNYALLDSLISALDIAIDAGFSDFEFRSSSTAHTNAAGPFAKQSAPSPAESTFNSQIDVITTQLRLMSSRIRDAGTSHLRRTEAKSAIERLIVRLEHSVRTRPKAKKGIFGGVSGEQRSFLSGFLKQVDEKAADAVNVVPVNVPLSDREASDGSAVPGAEAV